MATEGAEKTAVTYISSPREITMDERKTLPIILYTQYLYGM